MTGPLEWCTPEVAAVLPPDATTTSPLASCPAKREREEEIPETAASKQLKIEDASQDAVPPQVVVESQAQQADPELVSPTEVMPRDESDGERRDEGLIREGDAKPTSEDTFGSSPDELLRNITDVQPPDVTGVQHPLPVSNAAPKKRGRRPKEERKDTEAEQRSGDDKEKAQDKRRARSAKEQKKKALKLNRIHGTEGEDEDEEETEFEVEKVLDKRKVKGKEEYYVKWKGYEHKDCTWEPVLNLEGAKKLVQAYEQSKCTERPPEKEKRPTLSPANREKKEKKDKGVVGKSKHTGGMGTCC